MFTRTIEAESLASSAVGYRVENIAAASNGQALSLVGGPLESGQATFNFNGPSADYRIILGTFDEPDGVSTFSLDNTTYERFFVGQVSTDQIRSTDITASAANKVELTLKDRYTVLGGSSFRLLGIEDAGEHARFDYIRFEQVSTNLDIQGGVADVNLDFWGTNPVTRMVPTVGGAGAVNTSIRQLDGPSDAFRITEAVEGSFTFLAGPNGVRPGTYNFEARAQDEVGADVVTNFQVHQQTIRSLHGGAVIQAEDSNYGNGFGIQNTQIAGWTGNFNSYRNDGLDVSRSADQLTTYISHIQQGESVSYTAWTPSGAQTLRVMAATNAEPQQFGVYVDNVFQGAGTITAASGTNSWSNWEAFRPVDVAVNLNGYYEKIELRALTGGGMNIDSLALV